MVSAERNGTSGACAERLVRDEKNDCGLSFTALVRGGGGAWNTAFEDGSGEDLYAWRGEILIAGDLPEE